MNYQNPSKRQKSFSPKNRDLVLITLMFLLLLPSINAQEDIQLKISKLSYEAGETIQAELIFSKLPIRNFDISLVKDNLKIPIGAIVIKLTDKRNFLYFDIPSNVEKGNYDLKIDNVIFLIDNNLIENSASEKIFINNINPAFYWLKGQKKEALEDILYSTSSLAKAGLNPLSSQLLEQQDPLGCFPKGDCKVKETALGLIALNTLNLETTKALNWLHGAQNEVSLGTFKVVITSGANACQVNQNAVNFEQGIGEVSVSGETQLAVNCSSQPSNIKLVHTYLGNLYELASTNEKEIVFNIKDNGCFGASYKSACDYETSLYATYALKKLNKDTQKSLSWLQQNYDEFTTLHHAFLLLIDNFQYSREWLINNQKSNGAWSKKALSIDNTEDLLTTSIASQALKSAAYGENGLNWLKDRENLNNWDNNILLTSKILFFAFQDDKLETSLSLNPGVLAVFKDQKDQARLTLSNKGNVPINIIINSPKEITVDKNSLTLGALETKSLFLTIDTEVVKESAIGLSYGNKSYTIPVLVSDELLSYVTNPLRFISDKSSVTFSIESKETKEGDIKFKNFGDDILTDVKLEFSGDLADIIALDTDSFSKVDINETKEVFTRINKDKDAQLSRYTGNLTITSKEGYSSILTIEVIITDFEDTSIMPTSSELEGFETEVVEEEEANETIPTEEITPRGSALPAILIIVFILVVVLVIFLIIRKKRKKRPIKVEVTYPKPTESERFKEHLRKLEELKK